MNNDQLLKMKPGREMDRTVALEIMGYIWATHSLRFSAELAAKWISTPGSIEATKGVYVQVKPEELHSLKELEDFDEQVPRFSTDDACAQLVANQMIANGYDYTLQYDDNSSELQYKAIFTQREGADVSVSAGTSAEAVVKAALLAK